jgi:hypothetical protein
MWACEKYLIERYTMILDIPNRTHLDRTIDLYLKGTRSDIPPIDQWDVSQVKDMANLFANQITSPALNDKLQGIGKWNVAQVETMESMFTWCPYFNQDLSEWDIPEVKNMTNMFCNCNHFNSGIFNLKQGNKVIYTDSMFALCNKFNQDISGWDVNNIRFMMLMFLDCKNFNQDLSHWNIHRDAIKIHMFAHCNSLSPDHYPPGITVEEVNPTSPGKEISQESPRISPPKTPPIQSEKERTPASPPAKQSSVVMDTVQPSPPYVNRKELRRVRLLLEMISEEFKAIRQAVDKYWDFWRNRKPSLAYKHGFQYENEKYKFFSECIKNIQYVILHLRNYLRERHQQTYSQTRKGGLFGWNKKRGPTINEEITRTRDKIVKNKCISEEQYKGLNDCSGVWYYLRNMRKCKILETATNIHGILSADEPNDIIICDKEFIEIKDKLMSVIMQLEKVMLSYDDLVNGGPMEPFLKMLSDVSFHLSNANQTNFVEELEKVKAIPWAQKRERDDVGGNKRRLKKKLTRKTHRKAPSTLRSSSATRRRKKKTTSIPTHII